MGENVSKDVVQSPIGRLFLPSLVMSRFATPTASILLSLLLIEIGLFFDQPVGVIGQISTARSIAAFLGSLMMGFLSIRYKHKSLLSYGLAILVVASLGCALSTYFTSFIVFFILFGLGGAMAIPLTTSLAAKHLPAQRRTSVIGILIATSSITYLVGAPLIRYLCDSGGWRFPFISYALPLPLLGLLFVSVGVPSEPNSNQSSTKGRIFDGYRDIFANRSAVACLVGNSMSGAAFTGISLYAVSFYREVFHVSGSNASLIVIFASLTYTLGALFSSRFVNRYGRKTVSCSMAFISGAFILSFTVLTNFWASIVLLLFGCVFSGVRATAIVSLIVEQSPEYRGAMMSINTASVNLGAALGSGVGGFALLLYGYRAVGPSLGLLGMVASLILLFLGVDPSLELT